MSKTQEALKLALEALEKCDFALAEELAAWDIDPPLHHVLEASNACGPAITAIREALAEQPALQQEPTNEETLQALREATQTLRDHITRYTSPPAQRKPLDAVDGDVLPPIGSRVFIRHGRDNDAHACTVTGYYAWPAHSGDKHVHRVFVRMVYEGTDTQQVRLLCDCYPTEEAALGIKGDAT